MADSAKLTRELYRLLPVAVAWVEEKEREAAETGVALKEVERKLAVAVGVRKPGLVRVAIVEKLPEPTNPELRDFAEQAAFSIAAMHGVTFGHSIFIRRGMKNPRLLSHELRHVYQYEDHGSIEAFLLVYLQQIVTFGYADAPLEIDARNHERKI